jgi:hypothetical protein
MIMCRVHGGHYSSLFVSKDIAWAMHQKEPFTIPYAVVTLLADGKPMLGVLASQDFIERFKLVNGSLDEAQLDANDEWVHQLFPVCGICFQEQFGFVPQSGPFPENDSGYSLLIQNPGVLSRKTG